MSSPKSQKTALTNVERDVFNKFILPPRSSRMSNVLARTKLFSASKSLKASFREDVESVGEKAKLVFGEKISKVVNDLAQLYYILHVLRQRWGETVHTFDFNLDHTGWTHSAIKKPSQQVASNAERESFNGMGSERDMFPIDGATITIRENVMNLKVEYYALVDDKMTTSEKHAAMTAESLRICKAAKKLHSGLEVHFRPNDTPAGEPSGWFLEEEQFILKDKETKTKKRPYRFIIMCEINLSKPEFKPAIAGKKHFVDSFTSCLWLLYDFLCAIHNKNFYVLEDIIGWNGLKVRTAKRMYLNFVNNLRSKNDPPTNKLLGDLDATAARLEEKFRAINTFPTFDPDDTPQNGPRPAAYYYMGADGTIQAMEMSDYFF